ncbi:hypothetical protein BIU82_16770 [Arthrobacter sp. SW1]|uniref:hypothetical protein n=1 Tax=Arthrobacter sp. SW1 TaxID=1920889 RepID=UPI000877B24A|nr:hypothetical protein [Arthrobacter sp. SW1]OFI38956.1 hypothetical protein BIU82_16770 [Arthrobacter sp. SW1]
MKQSIELSRRKALGLGAAGVVGAVAAGYATAAPATAAVRADLIPGTYKPTSLTTGVITGTVLKPYNTSYADLVITRDGTVLENLDIYGDIKVRARNVVIRNCRLRGGKHIPSSNTGVVDANSAYCYNLLVQDCTIIPDRPSYYRDGIVGHEFTARRNTIMRSNDGIGVFNRPGGSVYANVVIEGNLIKELTYWSNDPAHSDGTHNDGIQVQGGQNIRIVGNTVIGSIVTGAGSAPSPRGTHGGCTIMLQQNVAKLANVLVERNWVDDGQTSINIAVGSKYADIVVTVQKNFLGRNQFDFGNGSKYPIRIISRSRSKVSGLFTNRWEDNNVYLAEGRNLGIRYDS